MINEQVIVVPTWTTPGSFGLGWGASGGGTVLSYARDPTGRVSVRGNLAADVSGNAATHAAFTLPASFRPAVDRWFSLPSSRAAPDAFAVGVVHPDGTVTVDAYPGTIYFFDSVSFPAEQ